MFGREKLTDGRIAVAVTNMGADTATIDVCFADLFGSTSKSMAVRDLWKKQDLGNFQTMYSPKVDSHDTVFVALTPQKTFS